MPALSNSVQVTTDFGIPALSAVLDPVELCRHLGFFSFEPWRWGELRDAGVEVLRSHSGSRCTMEITLRTTSGAHALIAKAFASDGLDIYQAMKRISRAGFGPEAEFSIPQALDFLPALHLLLQEKVEGPRAEELFLTGQERECTFVAECSARWLARFHAVAPKAGPVFNLASYMISLERWSSRIAEMFEPLAGKATQLFKELERAAGGLGPADMCAGHGDFKPAHVIIANGRTATCDWDRFDVADPCRDVARFVVATERLALRHFGSVRALDACAESFIKTYTALGRPGVERRLPFHMAAICVQFAKYDISQSVPGWRNEIEALLDEGLWILEEHHNA
jgi:hypothetical protein